jgi:cell fate (sporulation/competence/biofilm development) regulator YlbF (YheA/YmcA/DUF963 family)
MEQQGFLDFNDEKVNKDKLGEGLPQLQGNYKKGTEVGSSLQDTFGVYKGARLGNEDIVRSQKIFGDRVNKDKVAGVALLVQNHTGKVTDQSYGVFTLQQKTEIALKIAQMFLLNYKAGNQNKNEIYIRGQNLEMSNKVFATLMFFKQNDPSLKDLIIKSSNPDGIGPQYKWHTRDKVVDHTFIQDHLDSIVLLQLGQAASKQSAQSRETFYPTEDKGKNIKTNINNLLSNLYEGDEIAAEGLIRKEHTQEPQPQLSHKVEAKQKIQKLLKYFKLDINDIADNQVFRAATNLHHKLQELHEQMFNKPIDFDSLKMFSEQCKTAINENITLKTYFEDDNCLENLSKEITTVIAKFVSLSFKEGIAAVKESNVEQVDAEEDQTIQEEGVGRNIVP